jgi:hypothetical protein
MAGCKSPASSHHAPSLLPWHYRYRPPASKKKENQNIATMRIQYLLNFKEHRKWRWWLTFQSLLRLLMLDWDLGLKGLLYSKIIRQGGGGEQDWGNLRFLPADFYFVLMVYSFVGSPTENKISDDVVSFLESIYWLFLEEFNYSL